MESDGFLQQPPRLGNQFVEDEFLRSQLRRMLPENSLLDIQPDLESFGWEVATTIKKLGFQAEEEPTTLEKHDAWGKQVDALITSPAWRQQKEVAAREGVVAIAYERQHGQHSRIYQVAKLVLYGASSGLFNCPLAMTDGAARICELNSLRLPVLGEAFQRLTSRDSAAFWTSGQWMTERGGGSDVAAATETMGAPEAEGRSGVGDWYRLHGYKWFTSAADGEMAFALAREFDPAGQPIPGNKGLSMFYVPITRDADGCPQGFEVVRLKDKLGTRQLPTAELRLRGMRALKVSERGRGVPAIAAMVNITRVHNAAAAVSFMRRMTALAQDYARRRRAFGALLIEQPLALRTLAWMELHTCACTTLLLDTARLLGLQEVGKATPADVSLLRLLTPLAKLFTAKEAVVVASEGVEFFGGQGYIESTHIPRILRDAQVLPVWEGTTNVLSLDLLRVLAGDPLAATAFLESCTSRLASAAEAAAPAELPPAAERRPAACGNAPSAAGRGLARPAEAAERRRAAQQQQLLRTGSSRTCRAMHAELLRRVCTAAGVAVQAVAVDVRSTEAAVRGAGRGQGLPEGAQAGARDLAFAMACTFVAVLLAEHAAWSGSPRHLLLAAEWCRQELGDALLPPSGSTAGAAGAALGGSPEAGAALGGSPEAGAAEHSAALLSGQEFKRGLDPRVMAARVIVRADEPWSQGRARF